MPLPGTLLDRVLDGLQVDRPHRRDLDDLTTVYGAWCRRVPFDNVRKRIALAEGHEGPLPGDDADDFFRAWLDHGTGGTCWAGNGALHALLAALGFDARRGVCTMLSRPDLVEPNHGTVTVVLPEGRFLVDASMLHVVPLEVVHGAPTAVRDPAWGVRCRWREGVAFVRWHPLRVEAMECRVERLDAPPGEFGRRHELSRAHSGFNDQLTVRAIRGDAVVGVIRGERVDRGRDGRQTVRSLEGDDRIEFLTATLSISEEMAVRLPPDVPRPPDWRVHGQRAAAEPGEA